MLFPIAPAFDVESAQQLIHWLNALNTLGKKKIVGPNATTSSKNRCSRTIPNIFSDQWFDSTASVPRISFLHLDFLTKRNQHRLPFGLEKPIFRNRHCGFGRCRQVGVFGCMSLGRCQDVSLSKRDGVVAYRFQEPLDEQVNGILEVQRCRIVQHLNELLEPGVFEMWFGNGELIVVDRERVRFGAANHFQLGRIQSRYFSAIRKSVEYACGKSFPVEFGLASDDSNLKSSSMCSAPADAKPSKLAEVAPSSAGAPAINTGTEAKLIPPAAQSMSQRSPQAQQKRGVDSFWFGESNRLARAGIEQMYGQLGLLSPLVFYGPAGCGKSHLLESIVIDARRKHQLKRCVYMSAEQFTSNFIESLRGTGLPVFRRKYRDLDVLAIDDVQFFAGKQATLVEFHHTFDVLTRAGKQVILSSDRPPADLGVLGSDISARIMSGLVCPLNYPDVEGRKRILTSLCKTRGFQIPESVVDLISRNLARDVRRLSGAVNRLHAFSVASGHKVDLDLAQHALTDLFSISASQSSLGSIEKAVCDFCRVQPSELKSDSRQKRICAARMLAMYLSRKYTANAFSEIGDYFGRSHSTVIAAHRKVATWVEINQSIELPHASYLAQDAVVQIESTLRVG